MRENALVILCVGLAGATVCATGLLATRRLLSRFEIFDVPEARSSHDEPVLRGAGVAVGVAFIFALMIGMVLMPDATSRFAVVAAATAAATALGAVEDFAGVGISRRFALQIAIGVLVAGSIWAIADWTPLLILSLAAIPIGINVTNFMDGVDLLSGLHGVIWGVALITTGVLADTPWLICVGVALAAALGVFLPFNVYSRRRMFLGDSGSYMLGAAYVTAVIAGLTAGVPALVPISAVAIYVADTTLTLARRAFSGKDWRKSHREHHYHQLEDLGWTHMKVAGFVSLMSGACLLLGVAASTGAISTGAWVALILVSCAVYLCTPVLIRWRRSEARGGAR